MNGHISHGKWNEAFQTALMANNLQLVVATCESVNPMQLFNQNPCPLSQSVLLSLIQQLGKLKGLIWEHCLTKKRKKKITTFHSKDSIALT